MSRYEPLKIEQKWQEKWEREQPFRAIDGAKGAKMFVAEMFPYPSAAGLHVGHVRNFSIVDALARFYAQNGLNVLRPFGYDTFGLPAENYAIKFGVSPQEATETNIASFRKQLKRLGYAIDWSREYSTSDPEYYRWTQWCFLQLFKKGLAYRAESYQWWCPVDQTVLANEQVEGGKCWRCGTEVEKKKMKQWFFKITAYADELLDEIDALDWPEKIKVMQKNWIGRKRGINLTYRTINTEKAEEIVVFTTRPDTNFGATFVVLAPEHPLVEKLIRGKVKLSEGEVDKKAIAAYRKLAMSKSEVERQEEGRKKTGVFTGLEVTNQLSGEKMPVYISDFVLASFGTGAVVGVPGHDRRDFEFAREFDLPIKRVVIGPDGDESPIERVEQVQEEEGVMINSDFLNGMDINLAIEKITDHMEDQAMGKRQVIYRMHDWLISRQRYWGAPIPIAYDKKGKAHAIPEDQLPVLLPKIDDYSPDNSGRSALAKDHEWMRVTINGEEMTRETDTMDGYACSSWYLWRYCDPHNNQQAWDPEKVNYWAPTDIYCGGDHAVAHLLYVRFWCKFFADLKLLNFREPVKKLLYNGYINGPDGKKMSKSKGNVIDPLDVIDQGYGADTLRTYELFIGPYEMDAAWDTKAIGGVYRFLNRCYNLVFLRSESAYALAESTTEVARHHTIKKVTLNMRRNGFNTAVAALMEFVNELNKNPHSADDLVALARLLKPFAPHLASEMLEELGADDVWPEWDEGLLTSDTVEIVVQVNGKLRARVMVASEVAGDAAALEQATRADEKVAAQLTGKKVVKVVVVPRNRLVNFVVGI